MFWMIQKSLTHFNTHLVNTESTRKELTVTQRESQRMILEKNDLIASLSQRIQSMEGSYESVLNVSQDFYLLNLTYCVTRKS